MKNGKEYVNYLTVVMPAYNEESMIKDNLLKAASEISEFAEDYYIIAVDDGSRDNTKAEMEKAADINNRIKVISYSENRGKGYAVRRGMAASRAEFTAFVDSDLELPPSLLKGYLEAIEAENADVCIGSKLHKDSHIEYSILRKIMSYGYYFMLKLLFRLKLKDTQTGIKLFRTDCIKTVLTKLRSDRFSFDIEMLAVLAEYGFKIIERPVTMVKTRGEEGAKSKISIKQVFRMFGDTLVIKKRIKQLRKTN